MKLSESQLRNLIRKELRTVLEMHGRPRIPPAPNPYELKSVIGSVGASLSAGALVKLLQANPHLMEKVQEFVQSLMQEE